MLPQDMDELIAYPPAPAPGGEVLHPEAAIIAPSRLALTQWLRVRNAGGEFSHVLRVLMPCGHVEYEDYSDLPLQTVHCHCKAGDFIQYDPDAVRVKMYPEDDIPVKFGMVSAPVEFRESH